MTVTVFTVSYLTIAFRSVAGALFWLRNTSADVFPVALAKEGRYGYNLQLSGRDFFPVGGTCCFQPTLKIFVIDSFCSSRVPYL